MAYSIDERTSSRLNALSFFPAQDDQNGKPTPADAHRVVKNLDELVGKVTQINTMRQQSAQANPDQKSDYAKGLEFLTECRKTISNVVSPTKDIDINNIFDEQENHTPGSFRI